MRERGEGEDPGIDLLTYDERTIATSLVDGAVGSPVLTHSETGLALVFSEFDPEGDRVAAAPLDVGARAFGEIIYAPTRVPGSLSATGRGPDHGFVFAYVCPSTEIVRIGLSDSGWRTTHIGWLIDRIPVDGVAGRREGYLFVNLGGVIKDVDGGGWGPVRSVGPHTRLASGEFLGRWTHLLSDSHGGALLMDDETEEIVAREPIGTGPNRVGAIDGSFAVVHHADDSEGSPVSVTLFRDCP